MSTVDPISLVMKRISDLPLRKVSSRQLNLSGKLLGAPHGLEKGRELRDPCHGPTPCFQGACSKTSR